MSDTKYSSSGNPSDSWVHEFYNPGASMFDGRDRVASDSISTIAPAATATNASSHHGSSSSQYLNLPVDQGGGGGAGAGAGGRGSKPIRRRSRASRRTPTTLLNTDTTNFRAMVQQFTGGPATPYAASTASGSHSQYPFPRGGSNFGFGLDGRNQALNPPPPPSFYHLQFQQQQRHQQQQQEQHEQYFQHQPPYMFSFMNNSRPDMEDANDHAGAGGFSIDHVPYSLPRPPSSMP